MSKTHGTSLVRRSGLPRFKTDGEPIRARVSRASHVLERAAPAYAWPLARPGLWQRRKRRHEIVDRRRAGSQSDVNTGGTQSRDLWTVDESADNPRGPQLQNEVAHRLRIRALAGNELRRSICSIHQQNAVAFAKKRTQQGCRTGVHDNHRDPSRGRRARGGGLRHKCPICAQHESKLDSAPLADLNLDQISCSFLDAFFPSAAN